MTTELTTIFGAIGGVVLLIALVVRWWMNREPKITRHPDDVLPLFGGMDRPSEPDAGVMAGGAVRQQPRIPTPPHSAPAVASAVAPAVAPMPTVDPARPAASGLPSAKMSSPAESSASTTPRPFRTPESNPSIITFTTAAAPRASAPAAAPPATTAANGQQPTAASGAPGASVSPAELPSQPVVSAAGVPGTMVEGQLLRFSVPAEGTLQFLPGRLEIASGRDSGREIRFVNVPGPDGTVVTFGRSEGELYRHIQLRDQTVSRQHARLRLLDSTWHLLNFSQTNPVVHNGRVLSNSEEQALTDGDRIEMGEVLFTFRSR